MLTNLDWIDSGQPFPPVKEARRIEDYHKEAQMFNGNYSEVYSFDFANKALNLKMKDVNVSTVVNYPQLLSKKTADFVCGEPPEIYAGNKTDAVKSAVAEMNLAAILYEALIDVSRFGNAILKTTSEKTTIVPPDVWFPIVDEFDRKKIVAHVLAFKSEGKIYVEIHEDGRYERRLYVAEKGQGRHGVRFGLLLESETVDTGVDENAVQCLSNVTTSDSLYGISDYSVIKDVHKELMWRIFCAERILNKHAAPSIVGPSSMLQKDSITGLQLVNTGNFFARDNPDTPTPQYLTWDGNMQAVQWEIEWLTNQMYTLSEMGAAFLEGAGKGEVNSGRALKLRMTSPLIKAQRLAGINDVAVKKIIKTAASIYGIAVDLADIAITWNDGLPNDPIEDVEIYKSATGDMPIMSQYKAVQQYGGLSDEETDAEMASIAAEHGSAYIPENERVSDTVFIDTIEDTGRSE